MGMNNRMIQIAMLFLFCIMAQACEQTSRLSGRGSSSKANQNADSTPQNQIGLTDVVQIDYLIEESNAEDASAATPTATPTATAAAAPAPTTGQTDNVTVKNDFESTENSGSGPGNNPENAGSGSGNKDKENPNNSKDNKGDDNKAKEEEKDNSGDIKSCAEFLGIETSRVKVAGSKKVENFTAQDGLFMKITGNRNKVSIKVEGINGGKDVKGICIFIAGNKNTVSLDLKANLGKLYYIARGNQSVGTVEVQSGSKFAGGQFDMAGNQGKVTIKGAGEFSCDVQKQIRGNDSQVICEKP
ncbi:MAG: hypothetical protein HQK54_17240 [Oligoflexales bacterium]|nr:hypothetical protein [Oligoflexales bacterium]